MRRIGYPPELQAKTARALERLEYATARPGELSAAVKRLSDFYIANPAGSTPWGERWAQAAYLAYFLPLNFARASAVAREGLRAGFFSGLESMIDFGSGPGTAQLALARAGLAFRTVLCVDQREEPLTLHQALAGPGTGLTWRTSLPTAALPSRETRLAVFSYVATELDRLPSWAAESEAILLIEPSTREDGRRLLERRRALLEMGFHAYAPCTHQGACPLLEKSGKDWCHDRIAWDPPPGWGALESGLPMKNRTLTFSYLLARRTPPAASTAPRRARVIGDPRAEKGKTRQLLCRGPEREFLAWFPRRLSAEPALDRGDLVELGAGVEIRANEVRLKDPGTELQLLTPEEM